MSTKRKEDRCPRIGRDVHAVGTRHRDAERERVIQSGDPAQDIRLSD